MIPFGSALKCSFTIARDSTRKVMSFLDCVPFFRSHDLNHKICRMVRLNIAAHSTLRSGANMPDQPIFE